MKNTTIEYYMEEGCGIFAAALATLYPQAYIWILSRAGGEPFTIEDEDGDTEEIVPYEVTHVCVSIDDIYYDVKGARSPEEMAEDFDMDEFEIKGPFSLRELIEDFMGDSDDKPLFGDRQDITDAIDEIKKMKGFPP